MSKINVLIYNNLANPDLDVSYLIKKMTMSRASLYNKVVTIDFQTVFSTVTANITNETTGEIISSELFINPTSFSIDLYEKDTGDYMIEIISNEILLEGHFSL